MFDLKGKHEHVFLSILNKYVQKSSLKDIWTFRYSNQKMITMF